MILQLAPKNLAYRLNFPGLKAQYNPDFILNTLEPRLIGASTYILKTGSVPEALIRSQLSSSRIIFFPPAR